MKMHKKANAFPLNDRRTSIVRRRTASAKHTGRPPDGMLPLETKALYHPARHSCPMSTFIKKSVQNVQLPPDLLELIRLLFSLDPLLMSARQSHAYRSMKRPGRPSPNGRETTGSPSKQARGLNPLVQRPSHRARSRSHPVCYLLWLREASYSSTKRCWMS